MWPSAHFLASLQWMRLRAIVWHIWVLLAWMSMFPAESQYGQRSRDSPAFWQGSLKGRSMQLAASGRGWSHEAICFGKSGAAAGTEIILLLQTAASRAQEPLGGNTTWTRLGGDLNLRECKASTHQRSKCLWNGPHLLQHESGHFCSSLLQLFSTLCAN